MNTADGDLAYALKNYEPWRKLAGLIRDPEALKAAFEEAWNMGHAAGYRAGVREADMPADSWHCD